MTEKALHKAVCQYLRLQHPTVMFNTDMSGFGKLTIGQSVQLKSLRSNKGWPDLFIARRSGIYCGLFLELKAEGTRLRNKAGKPATEHIQSQSECMDRLRDEGYAACFAVGFERAVSVIDTYLK